PAIWSAVPDDVRRETDWWWVLYPSHVPERHAPFATTEFVTGGMGVGPDGASPCFIVDDRWLVRKPPHLGRGAYSTIERRAYLPQWLQHEWFHHLFRTFPEFGLEADDHQWFDRLRWPDDFEGRIEPDYYHEALHRRLKGAVPPMHHRLRYATPSRSVLMRLQTADLLGPYRREPVENDWHEGVVERAGTRHGPAVLRWTNAAGVSWGLEPDLANGALRTGEDNPYHASHPETSDFHLVLRRDDDGESVPEVAGFRFLGGVYAKVDEE
ncbi:MAG: hypothetical protein ACF8XB_18380, partial [Planctomycetota bacterium JB042]